RTLTPRFDINGLLGETRKRETRRRFLFVGGLGAPLAAAAALVLLLRGPTEERRTFVVQRGPALHRSHVTPSEDPDTTFKGSLQVSVVRELGKVQSQFVDKVTVKPGDRLRIQVAIDRPRSILAGVLGDDGTFAELMPEGIREAGTHSSEKS